MSILITCYSCICHLAIKFNKLNKPSDSAQVFASRSGRGVRALKRRVARSSAAELGSGSKASAWSSRLGVTNAHSRMRCARLLTENLSPIKKGNNRKRREEKEKRRGEKSKEPCPIRKAAPGSRCAREPWCSSQGWRQPLLTPTPTAQLPSRPSNRQGTSNTRHWGVPVA